MRFFPLLGLALLTSCSKVTWSDSMPKDLVGTWVETNDDIIDGYKKPAIIIVKPAGITYRWADRDKYETNFYPFIKANHDGSRIYYVFCGKPHPSTISDHRYRFTFKDDISFVYVDDIVADGRGEDDTFPVGRFVRK